MINSNNFYTVFYWMISELHLKGSQLIVYAIIYSFSKSESGCFHGSLSYLSQFASISKQSVITALKFLCEKNYVIKCQKTVNNVKFNTYQINSHLVKKFECDAQKITPAQSNNFNDGSQNTLTNNIYNIYNENKDDIYNEVLQSFNLACKALPEVKVLTDSRKKRISSFVDVIGEYGFNAKQYFEKVQLSDYLSGRNGIWINCSFDWLISRENAVKVCEGNYDNTKAKSKPKRKSTYDLEAIKRYAMNNTEI